jgi:hypothetical protein
VKDFYNENYKPLRKKSETTEDGNPCSIISRSLIVKRAILSKAFHIFNLFP